MSDEVAVSVPKSVPMKDRDAVIGKYVVLYRNDKKTPVKVIGFNKDDRRITYELMGGANRGDKFSSKFDDTQMALVYDEGNKVLAFLET